MSERLAARGRIGALGVVLCAIVAVAAIAQLARTRKAGFERPTSWAIRATNAATYASPAVGFSIALPDGMTVERRLEPIVTEIADAATRVQVFRQDLRATSFAQYVNYKSMPIRGGADPVVLLFERNSSNGSLPFHEMRWTRPELREVPADRRHHAAVDFRLGEHEVASVQVETADEAWIAHHLEAAIASFRAFPASQAARPRPRAPEPRAAALAPEARAAFDRLFGGEGRTWGIFEPGAPSSFDTLREIERGLDYRFGILLVYTGLDDAHVGENLAAAWREGRLVELTLQVPREASATSAAVYEVLAGRREQEIRSYARSVAQFGHPVLFRLDNEMNGDWVKYSAYWTSQDAHLFQATWRYFFRLFAEEGASNAIWIWNPNDRSFPDFGYNQTALYDPGPGYYDVVGMTGYNNGTYYPTETWRSFDEIYAPIYRAYRELFPGKPFMITEFASSSIGGDKASWISDAFARLPRYPEIKVAVWWNGIDLDGATRARPYRLMEDASIDAFRRGLAGTR